MIGDQDDETTMPAAGAPRWTPVELGGDMPAAKGAYSRAARAAGLLFVSGQVPRDLRTGELAGEDLETQTRAVLENLRAVLASAGAGLQDVVSVTVYLQDVDDWDAFNAVYREVMPAPWPSRTVVGADLRGIRVELSAVAVSP
jgi:reactive intermediate/imine deaminase